MNSKTSTKELNCTAIFTKSAEQKDDNYIYVEGAASLSSKDRGDEIIFPDQWTTKALKNFKKNPIICAQHDSSVKGVIGKCFEITPTDTGLHIKAQISKRWEDSWKLEDGLINMFSIGFIGNGFQYNEKEKAWTYGDIELLEISVVGIGMHQGATFSLSKSFKTSEDYESFKAQNTITQKEDNMDLLAKLKDFFAKKEAGTITDAEALELKELVKINEVQIKEMLEGEVVEPVAEVEIPEVVVEPVVETTPEATTDAGQAEAVKTLEAKVKELEGKLAVKSAKPTTTTKASDPSPSAEPKVLTAHEKALEDSAQAVRDFAKTR
jgi:phage head maturation protease